MRHLLSSLVVLLALSATAQAVPVTTDSRIKTFVYNENEVFTVTTHYGYQSNIEFGDKETIDTVSIGDRVAWQIIPAGRRLFIRAMEENAHTNMTIVTNLRAYQFDLRSSSADAVFGSEELTYVVRFYYPGENGAQLGAAEFAPITPVIAAPAPAAPTAATPVSYTAPAPTFTQPPVPAAPAYTPPPAPAPVAQAPAAATTYNYKYTFSGPSTAAPVKIYDDGRSTYFKFRSGIVPNVAVITTRGEQIAVPARSMPGNIVAVDIIAPRFSLNQPGGQVIVYNESSGA